MMSWTPSGLQSLKQHTDTGPQCSQGVTVGPGCGEEGKDCWCRQTVVRMDGAEPGVAAWTPAVCAGLQAVSLAGHCLH